MHTEAEGTGVTAVWNQKAPSTTLLECGIKACYLHRPSEQSFPSPPHALHPHTHTLHQSVARLPFENGLLLTPGENGFHSAFYKPPSSLSPTQCYKKSPFSPHPGGTLHPLSLHSAGAWATKSETFKRSRSQRFPLFLDKSRLFFSFCRNTNSSLAIQMLL